MHLLGPGSSGSSPGSSMAAVIAMVLASRWAGADAALVDGECNQTDSTATCCLKQNPGQYEKCGATPPAQQQPSLAETKPPPTETQPLRPPPLIRASEEDKEKENEFREENCQRHYEKCVERAGLKPNIQYGQSHCMACKQNLAYGTVLDTITQCYARGIRDEDQILNLCYIRFIINADVFTNESFAYILNNGLVHPYAKARHLILSFFAINTMRAGA